MSTKRNEPAARRALSAAVLDVQTAGPAEEAGFLHDAWQSVRKAVSRGQEEPTALPVTHGFHSYPARVSPTLVNSLLHTLAPPGGVVHDPFCGGGTVPLCALLRGFSASGSDLSPVALMVARARTRATTARERRLLVERAEAAVESSQGRGRGGQRPRLQHSLFAELREWYAPHTLQELTALRDALYQQPRDPVGGLLRACFSSLLIKFSYQTSETSRRRQERSHSRGAPGRLLIQRAGELAEGLNELAESVPLDTPAPLLVRADARDSEGLPPAAIDLVISSPPYPGTYDYGGLQALRMAWLGMSVAERSRGVELGTRASFGRRSDTARSTYVRGLAGCLRNMAAQLAPGAPLLWVIGDGAAQGERVLALPLLEEASSIAGWGLVARATAVRPAFLPGQGETRDEHLLWLAPRT